MTQIENLTEVNVLMGFGTAGQGAGLTRAVLRYSGETVSVRSNPPSRS